MTILVRSGSVAASRRYAMELVRPSSVAKTGASSTADIVGLGSVDFGLCETLSLNGVFSAEYDNYMISVRHVHSATDIVEFNARLRGSGTDASGSNYTFQRISANSNTVDGARSSSQTAWRMGSTSNVQRNGLTIYMYGPYLAQPTAARGVDVNGFANATLTDFAGTHSLSTAYDGITIYPASGNITGNVAVYGLRG